jgi:hypothetical protein
MKCTVHCMRDAAICAGLIVPKNKRFILYQVPGIKRRSQAYGKSLYL